jgi:hypothetical protein
LPKGTVYINGKPNQAQVLTASNDISDLDGLGAINYQWLRSGSFINGANQLKLYYFIRPLQIMKCYFL